MTYLVVIPTPVGNLEDITLRALKMLNQVDIVLAEDTRQTGKLLQNFDIKKKMMSYHAFNEHQTLEKIISMIQNGAVAGLVTDAGTPGISDPGFLLVRECIRNGIKVETLPGPTAFIPALVNSGLPCDRFCFEGFLPVKKGRKTMLESLATESRTMVFYESPHKILKTLKDLTGVFGEDRNASLSRELSKIHEENIRGTLKEISEYYQNNTLKGEITLIVEGFKR